MKQTRQMQEATERKFIVAFTKYFGSMTSVSVAETTYTPAQLTQVIQSRVDQQVVVDTARGTLTKALSTEKTLLASTQPIFDSAKLLVLAVYASSPAVLSEFGMVPKKKRATLPVAAKQAASLQAKATRVARHTMGPKAKEKIKGVVTDTSATAPSVAPSTVATTGSSPPTVTVPSVGSTVLNPQGATGH